MAFDLFGISITGAYLAAKSVEFIILSAIAFAAVKILPKFPFWFDTWIDQFFKLDFEQKTKEEMARIIRSITLMAYFVVLFYLLEVPNFFSNRLLQLILLFYGTKIVISIIRPSIRKVDAKINQFHGKSLQAHEAEHNSRMIETLVTYAVGAVAAVMGLSVLGYTDVLTAALASAGIVGITIGFAAKDVVANTLAGISIAFDRPLMYGETVEISGNMGRVEEIGLRMLKLKTLDNKIIMIPNALVTSGAVINYTRQNTRRFDIPISIAYEADLQKAVSILSKVPESIPGVITGVENKPIQILISGFGPSSVDLTVRFWANIRKIAIFGVEPEARQKVLKALTDNNIEIPYQKMVFLPANPAKAAKKRKKGNKKN